MEICDERWSQSAMEALQEIESTHGKDYAGRASASQVRLGMGSHDSVLLRISTPPAYLPRVSDDACAIHHVLDNRQL